MPSFMLATAPGTGGISIFHLRGIAERAPKTWADLRVGQIHRQWLTAIDGESIDEILLARITLDEYLLTGHGGSACALAIGETLIAFGYENAEQKLFGEVGKMLARCRTESQTNALAAAFANADENENFLRDHQTRIYWEEFLRPRIVILIGAVNVGKSSLFNCLLGGEHARVSPLAGTTRDLVNREIILDGMLVEVHDSAGLIADETELSPPDLQAIARSKSEWRNADLLIFVAGENSRNNRLAAAEVTKFFAKYRTDSSVDSPPPLIIAQNKSDLLDQNDLTDSRDQPLIFFADFDVFKTATIVKTSCRNEQGITDLSALIVEILRQNCAPPLNLPPAE